MSLVPSELEVIMELLAKAVEPVKPLATVFPEGPQAEPVLVSLPVESTWTQLLPEVASTEVKYGKPLASREKTAAEEVAREVLEEVAK